jgi:hypothetical protein
VKTRWNQLTIKIDDFLSFIPIRIITYFFCRFFFWISPALWPNSVF